jgi:nucleoside-diphosphate-sugar epimerase
VSKVLVTGGSGFIGGHLAASLLAAGDDVYAASRAPRADGELEWVAVDLSDAAAVAGVFAYVEPDVVYHLAGYVSGARSLDAVAPSVRDTIVASVNVLVESTRAGARVVLAGSMEEPDSDDAVPASPYAAAKATVAAHAAMLNRLHGLAVVTLRLFMVYGPGQHDRSKLVPYVITSLLAGRRPELSSGARPVDWVYVDDVVEALLEAGRREGLGGETFDVGSGKLVTVRELVERLVAATDSDVEPDFGALPDRPNEVVRVAELDATRRVLGWAPRVELDEGLRRTVEWYRSDDRAVEEVSRA